MIQIQNLVFDRNPIHLPFVELNEQSPICESEKLEKLKTHQKANVYRMKQLEMGNIRISGNNGSNQVNSIRHELDIETRCGFLMDDVGSGKSYTALGLILDELTNEKSAFKLSLAPKTITMKRFVSSVSQNVSGTFLTEYELIDTNIILVPSHVAIQWKQYIKEMIPSHVPSIILTNCRQIDTDLRDYKIVVMTSGFYKKFEEKHGESYASRCVSRIFIDEADNIIPKHLKMIPHRFIWYITSNMSHISNWQIRMPKVLQTMNLFEREIVGMVDGNPLPLIVRSNPEFVRSSFMLPHIERHVLISQNPEPVTILRGLVNQHVIDALNANDVSTAIERMGIESKTEQSIIQLCLKNLEDEIKNNENTYQFKSTQYVYSNPAVREHDLELLEQKSESLRHRMECIKSRIQDSDLCSICYCDFDHKTFVDCCKNCFCLKCLNMWLKENCSCPMCKAKLSKKDIIHINENGEGDRSKVDSRNEGNKKKLKLDVFSDLLDDLGSSPEKKILIYSGHPSSSIYGTAITLLDQKQIRYKFVKGGMYVINNIVKSYKGDDLNVLMLNADSLATGMNLENTTDIIITHRMNKDIENQIIGRGQRCGRSQPLNVWYLYNENEMNE